MKTQKHYDRQKFGRFATLGAIPETMVENCVELLSDVRRHMGEIGSVAIIFEVISEAATRESVEAWIKNRYT